MAKISMKSGTLLAPLPAVMVSCGSPEKPNIVTVAWCGIISSQPPMTYISLRPTRFSYNLIKESGEFVINLTSEELVRAADWCGVYTGAKVDKFAKCRLTPEASTVVSCPAIAEAPVSIECRVKNIQPLGSHDMFVSEIVAVNVREDLLDDAGKLRMDKAKLTTYSHGEYFALGKKLGSFGFSVKKKSKPRKKVEKKTK